MRAAKIDPDAVFSNIPSNNILLFYMYVCVWCAYDEFNRISMKLLEFRLQCELRAKKQQERQHVPFVQKKQWHMTKTRVNNSTIESYNIRFLIFHIRQIWFFVLCFAHRLPLLCHLLFVILLSRGCSVHI